MNAHVALILYTALICSPQLPMLFCSLLAIVHVLMKKPTVTDWLGSAQKSNKKLHGKANKILAFNEIAPLIVSNSPPKIAIGISIITIKIV